MPSNDDLIKQIGEIDKDAETEGKSNAELANALKGLKLAAANAAEAERNKEPKVKKPDYEVAEGKCLTTKVGILSAGDAIEAEHLPGGKDVFDEFVEKGYIKANRKK